MNVKTILAAKGGDIVSIEATADLTAAAQLLAARRIGAIVIRGTEGRLAGILSERDIVRTIAQHGMAALSMSVAQVMTRNVCHLRRGRHHRQPDGADDRRKISSPAGSGQR